MSPDYNLKFEKFSGVFIGRDVSKKAESTPGIYSGTSSSGEHVTVYGPGVTYMVTVGDSFDVLLDERTPSRSIGYRTDIRNDPDNGVSHLDVLVPHTFDGDDLRKGDAVDVWLMQLEPARPKFMFLVNKSQRYARLTSELGVHIICERSVCEAKGLIFQNSLWLRYLALVVFWIILSLGSDGGLYNFFTQIAKAAVMFVLAIAVALKLKPFRKNSLWSRLKRHEQLINDKTVVPKAFIASSIIGYLAFFNTGWSPFVTVSTDWFFKHNIYAPAVFPLAIAFAVERYLSKCERASRELAPHCNQETRALIQEKYGDIRIIQDDKSSD